MDRRRVTEWTAITAAGALAPFVSVVLGQRTLAFRDTHRLYAPMRVLVVDPLRHGRLPLWNPHEGMGKPLFAEGIHSVLHPVSLAGAFLAPARVDFLVLAYLVLAALGAFVLARRLGALPVASAGAGLAYALSGYSVSMTDNLVFLAGLSTLPWLVAAARAAGEGSRAGTVLAALATACGFFSGDVQVTIVGLALGLALAADAGGARGAARAGLGMAAGILLAGVQIAATQEILAFSRRGVELTPFERARWPLEPARLLEWIVPGLFRGPVSQLPSAPSGARLPREIFANSVYLGAPVLVAAALGMARGEDPRRRRTARILGAAAAILLWLALGSLLGARQLGDLVPVWSRFRYPEKLMAPLGLCVAAAASLGIGAFADGRLPRLASRGLLALGALAAAALVALRVAPGATTALAERLLGESGAFHRGTLAAGLPHLVAAIVLVLAADLLRGEARPLVLALLVALAPGLAVSAGTYLAVPGAGAGDVALRLASDSPTARIAQSVDHAYGVAWRNDPSEASTRLSTVLLVPALNVARRIDTIEPYGAFDPARVMSLADAFGRSWGRSFRRFGLTHVVIPVPFDLSEPELYRLATVGGTRVQRDPTIGFEVWAVPHRPWAFFARAAMSIPDPGYALGAVLTLDERGEDGTVVVETSEPVATSPGRVLRVERGTESVVIEAESQGSALLVVQDAYWPGWRATVDGLYSEILPADAVVRAVRWPPGRHRLEMAYDPPGVRRGLWLSALGAALVAALVVLAARRRG